jgi:hypothetical protein
MEIRIKKIGTRYLNGDVSASDITNTFLVNQNGREFFITYRSHTHGSSLGLAAEEGILYTDRDDNTVHRQVITVGKICGISIESDEVVEGLSPWALRGVVLANRSKEAKEIRLIIEKPGKSSGRPMILIDGKPQEPTVLD